MLMYNLNKTGSNWTWNVVDIAVGSFTVVHAAMFYVWKSTSVNGDCWSAPRRRNNLPPLSSVKFLWSSTWSLLIADNALTAVLVEQQLTRTLSCLISAERVVSWWKYS